LQKPTHTDEVGRRVPANIKDPAAELLARRTALAFDDRARNAGQSGTLHAKRRGTAGNNRNNAGIEPAIRDPVEEILQRRTAAAEQDGEADRLIHRDAPQCGRPWHRIRAAAETGTGALARSISQLPFRPRNERQPPCLLSERSLMFSHPDQPPSYVPDASWPRYAFVPGRGLPHPVGDPDGHLFGVQPIVEKIDPVRWRECRAYLWGVDLFNQGFYWEAHEAWEGIWRSYDRAETPALFLQGLIKLAAAGVKTREGVVRGVVNLAVGAACHFHDVRGRADGGEKFCGLNVAELEGTALRIEHDADVLRIDTEKGPRIVFDFVLRPGEPVS
jgi:uncharacterized protein